MYKTYPMEQVRISQLLIGPNTLLSHIYNNTRIEKLLDVGSARGHWHYWSSWNATPALLPTDFGATNFESDSWHTSDMWSVVQMSKICQNLTHGLPQILATPDTKAECSKQIWRQYKLNCNRSCFLQNTAKQTSSTDYWLLVYGNCHISLRRLTAGV